MKADKPATKAARPARTPLPAFLGEQLLLFFTIIVALAVVDVLAIMAFTVAENTWANNSGPVQLTSRVSDGLIGSDTGYELGHEAAAALAGENCWAMLIGNDGSVAWRQNAPSALLLHHYGTSDVAATARSGFLEGIPVTLQERSDGVLIVGWPEGSVRPVTHLEVTSASLQRLIYLTLGIFVLDALIVFAVYALSKRRVRKSIEPVNRALAALAQGQPAHVQVGGGLQEVAAQINATSQLMSAKDEARRAWVAGVSHDIRTPLSVIMGQAQGIAADKNVPEPTRKAALAIAEQGERVRDLVSDLNIASHLEYDMQPVDLQPVHVAALLRELVTGYMNSGLDERFGIELRVLDEAAEAGTVAADRRLLVRALENLVNNAIRHNEDGCDILVTLATMDDSMLVTVADDGRGLSASALERFNTPQSAPVAKGVPLVKRIITTHNGSISFSPTNPHGLTAAITLPVQSPKR